MTKERVKEIAEKMRRSETSKDTVRSVEASSSLPPSVHEDKVLEDEIKIYETKKESEEDELKEAKPAEKEIRKREPDKRVRRNRSRNRPRERRRPSALPRERRGEKDEAHFPWGHYD